MNVPITTYRPGAAVIPLRNDGAVLVGRRTPHARSYVGYLAFPGGGQDEPDGDLPLWLGDHAGGRAARGCAMRELGEETGRWLLVDERGQAPAPEQAERFLHAMSETEHPPLGSLLRELGLFLDDRRLIALGRWFTADHRPRQFAVQQFLLEVNEADALTSVPHDELEDIKWCMPSDIEQSWHRGDVLLLPPIRHVITTLALHRHSARDAMVAALCQVPAEGAPRVRDIIAGVGVQPFRTPTLPPATHTNTVLLGRGDFLIVDPATPYAPERARFDALMASMAAQGQHPRAVVLTHHHIDHASDAARVADKYQLEIWAHDATAGLVDFHVSRRLKDKDEIVLDGPTSQSWEVLFTPGHAPGHICLFERSLGVLVAGDMVAEEGSILIDPDEGHIGTYLESLRMLAALPIGALVPSHGALVAAGAARLEEQIRHRLQRQDQVAAALKACGGDAEPADLVPHIYGAEVPKAAYPLAARSVQSALQLLVEQDVVLERGGRYHLPQ